MNSVYSFWLRFALLAAIFLLALLIAYLAHSARRTQLILWFLAVPASAGVALALASVIYFIIGPYVV
jgi:hypothetical protein